MRTLINAPLLLLVVGLTLIVTSCAKKGCIDEDATTYSSSAKKDDGTCRYEGSKVFWISDSSAQQMLNDGIQSLTLYIEDDIEAQIQLTSQTFTVSPDCGDANATTVVRNLLSARTRAFSYRVLDDQSVKRWAGAFTMNGNQCEPFELVYFP